MTRVHHARPQQATHRSTILEQPRAVVKKKKPYKIVLEAVTQEKKKLHSIVRRYIMLRGPPTDSHPADIRLKCSQRIWFHPSRAPRVYRVVQGTMPPTESRRPHRLSPQPPSRHMET